MVAFVPDLTTTIAQSLGIEQGMSLIAGFSIITLFYLLFRLYVKVENTEQRLTRIVRELAYEKKKK